MGFKDFINDAAKFVKDEVLPVVTDVVSTGVNVAKTVLPMILDEDDHFVNLDNDNTLSLTDRQKSMIKKLRNDLKDMDNRNKIIARQILIHMYDSYSSFKQLYGIESIHMESRTFNTTVQLKKGSGAVFLTTLNSLKEKIEPIVKENTMCRWLALAVTINNTSNRNGEYVYISECSTPSTVEEQTVPSSYIEQETVSTLNNNDSYNFLIPSSFAKHGVVRITDLIQQFTLNHPSDEVQQAITALGNSLGISKFKENLQNYYVLSNSEEIQNLESINYDFYSRYSGDLSEDYTTAYGCMFNPVVYKATTLSSEIITCNVSATLYVLVTTRCEQPEEPEPEEKVEEEHVIVNTTETTVITWLKSFFKGNQEVLDRVTYRMNRGRMPFIHKDKKFIRFGVETEEEEEEVEGDDGQIVWI